MDLSSRLTPFLLACLVLPACGEDEPAGHAVDAPENPIRLQRVDDRSGALEAAIYSYERDGVDLDVIAVLHLADQRYYDELAARFDDYDAVLYEMVKPEGQEPVRRGGDSVLSLFQRGMCQGLGLAFQLDALDYGRDNFVHADLTAEGFAERWEERDESVWKMLLKVAFSGRSIGGPGVTNAEMIDIVRSPDRKDRFKLVMAEVFANAGALVALGAPDAEGRDQSMLIGERNLAALAVLEREIEAGRERLAMLYGAGHVPDFDIRLTKDLGFRRTAIEWLDAWRMGNPAGVGEVR